MIKTLTNPTHLVENSHAGDVPDNTATAIEELIAYYIDKALLSDDEGTILSTNISGCFMDEARTLSELIRRDEPDSPCVQTRFAIEWGYRFGVRAALAVIESPPGTALIKLQNLVTATRREAQERNQMTNAFIDERKRRRKQRAATRRRA